MEIIFSLLTSCTKMNLFVKKENKSDETKV